MLGKRLGVVLVRPSCQAARLLGCQTNQAPQAVRAVGQPDGGAKPQAQPRFLLTKHHNPSLFTKPILKSRADLKC